MSPNLRLYTYFRSSCAFRVRIALNYKGIAYDPVFVHLLKSEQLDEGYRRFNPLGMVPALEHNGVVLADSLAILEYLEEVFPEPALLPSGRGERGIVRQMVQLVASSVQPLQNLRVTNYLKDELKLEEGGRNAWIAHWIELGFSALEKLLEKNSGEFSFGDSLSMADCCLLPQVFSSRRFGVEIEQWPVLSRVAQNLLEQDFCIRALPENQPDHP